MSVLREAPDGSMWALGAVAKNETPRETQVVHVHGGQMDVYSGGVLPGGSPSNITFRYDGIVTIETTSFNISANDDHYEYFDGTEWSRERPPVSGATERTSPPAGLGSGETLAPDGTPLGGR